MDWVSDTLSRASLVVVLVIGIKSVRVADGARMATEQDGRMRRVEGLLDVLIEMRDVYNEQTSLPLRLKEGWQPSYNSPEWLARHALSRKLEVRLVLFAELDNNSRTSYISRNESWSAADFETAIVESKMLLAEASKYGESDGVLAWGARAVRRLVTARSRLPQ
jgi:hypothetical protein